MKSFDDTSLSGSLKKEISQLLLEKSQLNWKNWCFESQTTPIDFVLPQKFTWISLMTCKFIPLIAINDFDSW